MSFVLEALKKQEAGSDPDAAASLARAAAQARRHRLWVGLFAVAMAANMALLVWVFALPRLTGPEGIAASNTASPAPDEVSTPAAAPQAPEQGQPGGTDTADRATAARSPSAAAPAPSRTDAVQPEPTQQAVARPEPVRQEPVQQEPVQHESGQQQPARVSLASLPADARRRFPGIAFSTHIWSEDPELRAIVANGERRREGERVRGLTIHEITETGVVMAFERYLVEVPLAADWPGE